MMSMVWLMLVTLWPTVVVIVIVISRRIIVNICIPIVLDKTLNISPPNPFSYKVLVVDIKWIATSAA